MAYVEDEVFEPKRSQHHLAPKVYKSLVYIPCTHIKKMQVPFKTASPQLDSVPAGLYAMHYPTLAAATLHPQDLTRYAALPLHVLACLGYEVSDGRLAIPAHTCLAR